MTLTKQDKLEVINYCLRVNDKPFVVDYPTESLSHVSMEGKLVTLAQGRIYNHWEPEVIEGYFA